MLIAFDFDGTLSDSEMTVLLGEEKDVAEEIAGITDRAMNGEIGYAESLRQRIELLEGLPEERMNHAFERIKFHEGAADLINDLRDAGVFVAILTGGFERGVESILERSGIEVDEIVANRLVLENGALTGEVEGSLIEGTKDEALERLATSEGVDLEDTMAVGDGANDLPMLRIAGDAIGYEPKPTVREECDTVVASVEELRRLLEERGVLG
ncbi:MAG: phosphoserine phosphatase SerB [Halobacteria archaeon]|nr:phosphoserine phosphatase SerB [Halobacteria archaeon]